MNEKVYGIVKKYVKLLITGGVICLLVMWWRGLFGNDDPILTYRILCDAFFVPSVLFIGAGLLSLAKADGFFDAIAYSFEWIINKTRGSMGVRDLYEYGKLKRDEGKRTFQPHALITGAVFLIVALWYQYLFYINTPL